MPSDPASAKAAMACKAAKLLSRLSECVLQARMCMWEVKKSSAPRRDKEQAGCELLLSCLTTHYHRALFDVFDLPHRIGHTFELEHPISTKCEVCFPAEHDMKPLHKQSCRASLLWTLPVLAFCLHFLLPQLAQPELTRLPNRISVYLL